MTSLTSNSDDIKSEIEKRKEEIRRKKEALEAYKSKKSSTTGKQTPRGSIIEGLISPHLLVKPPQQQEQQPPQKTEGNNVLEAKTLIVIPQVDAKKAAAIQQGELFDKVNNGTIVSEVEGEKKRVRELKLVSRVNIIDLPPLVSGI